MAFPNLDKYGYLPYSIDDKVRIWIDRRAFKQFEKLPIQISKKVREWVLSITQIGLSETRKIPGYHDEPLFGSRELQRSVRLNRSWRLIYKEVRVIEKPTTILIILEINKHAY